MVRPDGRLEAWLPEGVWYGFFMNWTGAQVGDGVEYHRRALATATAVRLLLAPEPSWKW